MHRILVVAPNWIGDALMAQPMLARLREKRPGVQIHMLAPEWVAPVARRMPEVDEVIPVPFRHGALQLGSRWRLARELKARAYDEAIVLPNTWKSALVPFLAAIPRRTGYLGEARYGLLNHLQRNPDREMRRHYARLGDGDGANLPQVRLRSDAAQGAATRERFGIGGRYAVLCPGAEYGPAKRWPYFADLAGRIGMPVVLLGSPKDAAAAAGIGGTNLIGKTTLDEAIDLIAGAELVVSNDSGLMHVAAALGKPLIALFGSSSPEKTPPQPGRSHVLWLKVECSPCYERECPLGHFRCMREMSVDTFGRNRKAMSARNFPTAQDAENAFYEALERCDLEGMMAVWAEDEDIVCVHPAGPRLTGHDQIRESWARIFSAGPRARVHITSQVAISGMMLAVHSVHENFTIQGQARGDAPQPVPVVATNVYLRTAAGWRMIVHHASPGPAAAQPAPREAPPKLLH